MDYLLLHRTVAPRKKEGGPFVSSSSTFANARERGAQKAE
jgi:hypothetical protein